MAKQFSLLSDGNTDLEISSNSVTNLMEKPTVISSEASTQLVSEFGESQLKTVRLNLEDLKCFEVVERQYQEWGAIFRNAIALQPSNPAFPPRSGTTLLLAAPKNGFLEIAFQQPVSFFQAHVTSSQRTILTAYDRNEKLLGRAELASSNLAGSNSPIPPNAELSVSAPNISRISFYAFDGQLTVDDITFTF